MKYSLIAVYTIPLGTELSQSVFVCQISGSVASCQQFFFLESYSSVAKFDQGLACFVVDNGQSDRGRRVTVLVSAGGGSCEVKLCQSCGSPGRTARGNSQEGSRGKSVQSVITC